MEQLINLVKTKAGVTDEQAALAVQAVVEHLKLKFPTILHSEIDKVVAGGDFGDSVREKFDGLRDKVEEAAKQVGTKAESIAAELKDKLNELFGPKKPS